MESLEIFTGLNKKICKWMMNIVVDNVVMTGLEWGYGKREHPSF